MPSFRGAVQYAPYGQVRYSYGTSPTTYNFTGQRLDKSTGLLYYGARYYDPALARFVQADTLVPDPANPQSLNRYAYVLNNPVRYTDPSGHCVPDEDCQEEAVARYWAERLQEFWDLYNNDMDFQIAILALANMLYGEQGGEPELLQRAAGYVAWNRAEHDLDNLFAVVSAANQFQGYTGPDSLPLECS